MSIVIIDFGSGNHQSIKKKMLQFDNETIISNDLKFIEKADKLILPGVGHFGRAVQNLKSNGLWNLLNYKVLEQKTPILGICLGMQLMAKMSEEGNECGFGWIDAEVKRFQISNNLKYKIPHMGWNDLEIKRENPLFKEIEKDKKYYFVHSFHLVTQNDNEILATTEYEYIFISSIWKNNIYGVQFHPEKSHEQGNQILKNFNKL